MHDQFRKVLDEHNKVESGEVVSPRPLSETQQSELAKQLGKARGKTMKLSYRTDPRLIGGLVVRLGNRVYDASVVKQLELFQEKAQSAL